VRILISKLPPTGSVEGIDLSHHAFAAGQIYEVGRYLAELLISAGYAQPARRQLDLSQPPGVRPAAE
jgi:hypothetical protein